MRIATAYAQQLAVEGIAERQAKLLEAQEQLSSGKRVSTPSDDPAAAAQAERLLTREARVAAEQRAATHARQMLSSADTALGDATDLLQSAREALLAASNATTTPQDRALYGEQLRQLRGQLLAVANRGDGTGGYVFGGQGTLTPPVAESGTQYLAPAGTQVVGQEQQNPVSLDGRENFTAIRTPSGTESIFERLDTAIAALTDPATTQVQAAAAAGTAIGSVDRAIDRFGVTRTVVGERLRALDAHEQALASGSIENQSRLSDLVDVDFARGASNMIQQQTSLEAALKSYAQVARMTLFDYV
ncbi:MAG TPA: flagellar hook-associated protein FlgL [Burkholderiaceae bacterium]|nr:flagellar hook-associated protein FlgL [Burkholderiaceae bacterium]